MSVTLKDLAKKLGMAPSTISRILRNDPRASEFREETRERVMLVAQEMGYKRNVSAATIRSGFNSSTIGILLCEQEEPIYPTVLRLIKNLNQLGFGARVYCSDDIHAIFQEIASNQIRYIINYKRLRADLDISVDYCRKRQLKMVIARNAMLYPDYPVFGSDDQRIMRDMVAYLYHLGHRKIALHCGSHEERTFANALRHAGFLDGVKAFGIEECSAMAVCPSNFSEEILFELLQKHTPTAICCSGTSLALQIELSLRDIGIRVPDDISLIAFGDMPRLQRYSRPQITSMKETEQGEMLEQILAYFRSGAPRKNDGAEFSQLCDAKLIVRGSTAAPNPQPQSLLKRFSHHHIKKGMR